MTQSLDHDRPRRRLVPRRAKTKPPVIRDLLISSADIRVPALIVRDSPTLMVAAVEDLCWRLALVDSDRRRPRRWRRSALAAWRAERRLIEDKRARIRSMVDESVHAS
ncbi:MAG TPA: hypothetical protein VFN97_14935 [Actinospica sp.]|nr:hypothetical protein [Actinospica sp.]